MTPIIRLMSMLILVGALIEANSIQRNKRQSNEQIILLEQDLQQNSPHEVNSQPKDLEDNANVNRYKRLANEKRHQENSDMPTTSTGTTLPGPNENEKTAAIVLG